MIYSINPIFQTNIGSRRTRIVGEPIVPDAPQNPANARSLLPLTRPHDPNRMNKPSSHQQNRTKELPDSLLSAEIVAKLVGCEDIYERCGSRSSFTFDQASRLELPDHSIEGAAEPHEGELPDSLISAEIVEKLVECEDIYECRGLRSSLADGRAAEARHNDARDAHG